MWSHFLWWQPYIFVPQCVHIGDLRDRLVGMTCRRYYILAIFLMGLFVKIIWDNTKPAFSSTAFRVSFVLIAASLVLVAYLIHASFSSVSSQEAKEEESITQKPSEIHITENVSFTTIDGNNGTHESLRVNIGVEILTPGYYTISGVLIKNDRVVSNQPEYEHAKPNWEQIGDQPGVYTATLIFSGEEIFRSGEDGPYDLQITAIGASFNKKSLPTPAYDHTKFGERKLH